MPEVALHEPRLALDGGADGLAAYRHILRRAPGLLARGGRLVLEIGLGQRPALETLAAREGLLLLATGRDSGRSSAPSSSA